MADPKAWARVSAGAAFTALCAHISIPVEPVPFTLQVLAVTLCGLRLGAREGMMSQVAYILAGVAGVPVFASGKVGPMVLAGPTGGYLVAFVLAAAALGWMSDRGLMKKLVPAFAALLLANFAVLTLGTAWISIASGWSTAFMVGFLPFVVGALAQALGALAVHGVTRQSD